MRRVIPTQQAKSRSPPPLQQAQQSLYAGVLDEHLRQKKAAIARALAREKCPGGAGGNITNAATNVTRSAANSGDAAASVLDMDEDGASLEEAGLGAKEIKNIFTELRKGANHPLMLLNYFKGGGKIDEVVDVLHRSSYFGGQATRDMVSKIWVVHGFCKKRGVLLPTPCVVFFAHMEKLCSRPIVKKTSRQAKD